MATARSTSPSKPGLLWPTILTLAGLAVLISLGTWQMRRLAWKEALIARVEAMAKSAPRPLADVVREGGGAPVDIEFHRAIVTGTFEHAGEMHVWSPGKRGPAWSVVTPLILADPVRGPAGEIARVLIIRGVVPDARKAAATRPEGNPGGRVEITGRIRLAHAGAFSSNADPARNQWYDYDLASMRAALASGATGAKADARTIAPFFVEAEAPNGGEMAPQPELSALNLSNRHLEYALTWYGLAVTLAAVYLAYALTRRDRPAR